MIAVGLAGWLGAIALLSIPMVVAAAILVTWSVYGLLTLAD